MSTCPAATRTHSSSGFTDHSRCARILRAGSPRVSLSRPSTTAPNAIVVQSFSQKAIRAADVPPSSAAAHCSALASGPYTVTWRRHSLPIALPTGSPLRRSFAGVSTYGLWPSATIRPYAA
jgi:hypothetical protein